MRSTLPRFAFTRSSALLTTLLLAAAGIAVSSQQPAHASVTRVRLGSAADVSRAGWNGPAFTMNGDGAVVPATMSKAIAAITGGTGSIDVTVLADSAPSSGSATPECDVIMGLGGVNSCTTDVVTSAADGNNSQVNTDVRNAEFVYFAGGNQCVYASWKGTALQASVQSVVAKGGGSGGGSAGTHINSAIVYDACGGGTDSPTALANPYDRTVTFTTGMFSWPNYGDTIDDSHFVTRDRMGRTMAFVARALKDGLTTSGKAWGVGIEQGGGSLFLDKNGLATLTGADAYVVLGDHQPEKAVAGSPLTYSGYKIWHLTDGSTFDFKNRPTCGYYLRSVTNGVADANLYSGTPVTNCGSGNTVTVTNPGNQTTAAGTAVNLQLSASDSASGQSLTYAASGLPAGLSISGSGLITGTPTTPGTSTVSISATDGTGASGSATLTWTVTGTGGGSAYAEVESNDTTSAANDITSLTYPAAVTGSMKSSSDRDYYRLSLTSGQTATVNCTVPSAYDADVYFMNASGSTLTRSVNNGKGVAEALGWTATSTGTYFLDVEAYSGSGSATYTCTISKS
ncbi:putative Ig domain-containing protein [Kitasatospora sp. NPDC059571]|uniref:putative Ig domain-containing protein n=1 Tax=Kitasatospora sp. NPDC059571 TaxID=3346871 RepID=UPI0036B03F11